MRQVLVGALLPAGAPDHHEALGQRAQVLAGGGRKVVVDALDVVEAPVRTGVQLESEQRDDAVDIDEKQGNVAISREFHVTFVTEPCCVGAASLLKLSSAIKAV